MACDSVAVMNAQLKVNGLKSVLASRQNVDALVLMLQDALNRNDIRVASYSQDYQTAQLYVGQTAVTLRADNVSATERGWRADQRAVDRIAEATRDQVAALSKRLGVNKAVAALGRVGRVTAPIQRIGTVTLVKVEV